VSGLRSQQIDIRYDPVAGKTLYSDWLGVGRPGFDSRQRQQIAHFSTSSRPALGSTQPPIQWVPGDISPDLKRLERDADHSPPSSAEVKKTWIYTSTPPYVFMV
jgi:hypothetical protein